MIKEVIVVEGRDDYLAVKRAVDAEIIITGGYSLPKNAVNSIKTAASRRGIIIFTDPDYAGEMIRKRVSQIAKGSKHAFLPVDQATKDGDIGIENASPEDIREALSKARAETVEKIQEFSMPDLIKYGLVGQEDSGIRRDIIGRILGIGRSNAKQFLSRLNNYNITREEFELSVKQMEERVK